MATSFRELVNDLEAGVAPTDHRTGESTDALLYRYAELRTVSIAEQTIPGPHGPVPGRIYRRQERPIAGLVWVHGGSFVEGDLDMPEANWVALKLASSGVAVLSLDYRKALHGITHPVPSDDVLAGWRWAVGHAEALGVSSHELHLGGASAGAALAVGAAMRARDDGDKQLPATLVTAYGAMLPELPDESPVYARTGALERPFRERIEEYRELCRNHTGGVPSPYASPATGDLEGLPPIFVLDSEIDDLRAAGAAFASAVVLAGGHLEYVVETDARHGHLNNPHDPIAHRSADRICNWIRQHAPSPVAGVERVCFQLQLKPDRIDDYRERHRAVWPEMLEAIRDSGRSNYSLFLRDDGLLIGYYETPDDDESWRRLLADVRAAPWEAGSAEFFDNLHEGRADQSMTRLREVFNLEQQLAALVSPGKRHDDDNLTATTSISPGQG
jgi:acetyl esterase